MRKIIIFLFLFPFLSIAQNKKQLIETINRLRIDSTELSSKKSSYHKKIDEIQNKLRMQSDDFGKEMSKINEKINECSDSLNKLKYVNNYLKKNIDFISTIPEEFLIVKKRIDLTVKKTNFSGTYFNEANQKLVISNCNDSSFNFDVMWGVNDEWGCLNSIKGIAYLIESENNEYKYNCESKDDPSFHFYINEKNVAIGFSDPMGIPGMDCLKFGDSQSEKYLNFSKDESE